MAHITQQHRGLVIGTPLGEDVLLLRAMTANEHLGRLFEYRLDLVSENHQIALADIVGQNVTIRLERPDGEPRYFNGYVSRFEHVGFAHVADDRHVAEYQATVVPWLWFLTRTTDCRIHQNMTVPDIIKQVFRDHGFTDFDDALGGSYREWEYCVQYRETDFNFVSRLMEQEGIYWYFVHENGKHTLVLADGYSSHEPVPGYEELPYYPPGDQHGMRERDHVWNWTVGCEVQPGVYALNDFDFQKPRKDLKTRARGPRPHANAEFEVFDHPGEYVEGADGETYVSIRLEELQAQYEVASGAGSAAGVAVGALFTLAGHPRADQNREYLVVSATHELRNDPFATSMAAPEDIHTVSFTAIYARQPYRSPRLTPKPLIQGPQTAIVVGKSGEEIWTDRHGRVKVQFHWDRYGTFDENSSCWVRVSQGWAGKEWGHIQIPRMGQEVIVEFLEGDPDRPIITGRVYNGDNMPPYGLPDNATQSGVKSRSTKGGTPANFNELRFEDKKGGEQVFLQAEKDLTIHVKNAEAETVGASITTNAGGSISRNSGADISRTADVNIIDKAGKDISVTSGKNMGLEVGGAYTLLTNLGIQLKAMNFVAGLIESGAKAAAAAIKKGADTAAVTEAAGGSGADAAATAGQQAMAALAPGIEAGVAELSALSAKTAKGLEGVEGKGGEAGKATAEFQNAVESGASPDVIASAFMTMAAAMADTIAEARAVIEGMFPQIPSIILWAMKDINALALWSMTLQAKVKDITIQAQNKDVHVKAKQSVNVEAEKKDLNVKASTKNVKITAKEEVSIKAEDKNLVVEAGKEKVFIKSPKQIFLKCGSASISMAESGNIVINGAKINIKGSGPVTVKGNPIKLN
jgi:type VI secretion system secreted protein VgrG